ncbi:MAG: NAD(P)H-dependent oxidoreductase [Rickettsiales bacterium]|nr:NAD(P)H-dependent oxidoreductase [Rickettsiales bacterium]
MKENTQQFKQKIIDAMNWRYATKIFDINKKINNQDWEMLEKSMIMSPSSFGLQPYQFLLVENQKTRKLLTPHSWNQPQIEQSSHLVVLTALKNINEEYIDNFIKLTSKTRSIAESNLAEYKKMMIDNLISSHKDIFNWASKQAYIALGNLMTTASLLDIDSCPIEGINPEKYDEILGITNSNYATICSCALGFRSADDKYQNLKKVRFNHDFLVKII